ncbi:MAG: histidine kinase dimerization/phospho-acceptor domain-containing protein, partial [Bacilli bacterium]
MGIARKIVLLIFGVLFVVAGIGFRYLYTELVKERADYMIGQLQMRGENYATMLGETYLSDTIVHVAEMERSPDIVSVVVDALRSQVLSNSVGATPSMLAHTLNDRRTIGTESVVMEHDYTNTQWVCTASPIMVGNETVGYVYMFQSAETIRDAVQPIASLVVWGFLFCILFSIILSVVLSRYLAKPILFLAERTRQYSNGVYEERFNSKRKDEVGVVMNDMDALGHRLQTLAYDREAFLRGVAHEIRTPLTYIRGWNEVLERKVERIGQTYAETTRIDHEIERLQHIVEDLLRTEHSGTKIILHKNIVSIQEWIVRQ